MFSFIWVKTRIFGKKLEKIMNGFQQNLKIDNFLTIVGHFCPFFPKKGFSRKIGMQKMNRNGQGSGDITIWWLYTTGWYGESWIKLVSSRFDGKLPGGLSTFGDHVRCVRVRVRVQTAIFCENTKIHAFMPLFILFWYFVLMIHTT